MAESVSGRELADLIVEWQVPGAALATCRVGRDAEIVVAGVTDRQSNHPVSMDTTFPVGSISKLVTATILMQLVDEGRLDLDRPVHMYLPELALPASARRSLLTPRHLITHTSGLDGEPRPGRTEADTPLRDVAARCHTLTRIAPPGRVFSYWNTGYVLLARVAEVLDGVPWSRILDSRLLQPLRLANTVFDQADVLAQVHTRGHLTDPADGSLTVMPFWTVPRHLASAGGLWMSVGDVLAVGRLLIDGRTPDGRRLLSDSALASMRQPIVEQLDKDIADAMGLGLSLVSPDHRWLGFGGTFLGQRTFIDVVPDRSCAMALLTNSLGGGDLHAALARRLIGDALGVRLHDPSRVTRLSVPPALDGYVGVFRRSDMEVTVSRGVHGLEVSTRPMVRKGGNPPTWDGLPLTPVDACQFTAAPPPPARAMSFFFLGPSGRRHDGSGRPEYVQYWSRTHARTAVA